jgi:hypothetical protein
MGEVIYLDGFFKRKYYRIKFDIIRAIAHIKWIRSGKPMKTIPGWHCGCCGRWVKQEIKFPAYQSEHEHNVSICCVCANPGGVWIPV